MSSIRIYAQTTLSEDQSAKDDENVVILLTPPGEYIQGEEVVKDASHEGVAHYKSKRGFVHRFVKFSGGEPVAAILVRASRSWRQKQSAQVVSSYVKPEERKRDHFRSLMNYARSIFRSLDEEEPIEPIAEVRTAHRRSFRLNAASRMTYLATVPEESKFAPGESLAIMIRIPENVANTRDVKWPDKVQRSGGPPHFTLVYITGPLDENARSMLERVIKDVAARVQPFQISLDPEIKSFPVPDNKRVHHKPADEGSAQKIESLAHTLEDQLERYGFTIRKFPNFIAHATLALLPSDEAYQGTNPQGSFVANRLELWGWHDTTVFPLGQPTQPSRVTLKDELEEERKRIDSPDTDEDMRNELGLVEPKRIGSLRFRADLMPGGKGDDRPDKAFKRKELEKGYKTEQREHGLDKARAKEIAKDHLTEDTGYYEDEEG